MRLILELLGHACPGLWLAKFNLGSEMSAFFETQFDYTSCPAFSGITSWYVSPEISLAILVGWYIPLGIVLSREFCCVSFLGQY
jgi:hypothetical protein